MKLSVIIPAYNSAGTIARCLDSLLPEAEDVIVVDDGSEDSTGELLRVFQTRYSSLRVITQENRGVSAARNIGMKACSGDYLVWVDADDYIEKGALSRLENELEQNAADVLVMKSFAGKEERYPWKGRIKTGRCYNSDELMSLAYLRGSVCGCAFSRSFLEAHNMVFPEHLSHSEDVIFMSMVLSAGAEVAFCDLVFYHVCPRDSSASKKNDETYFRRYGDALRSAGLITNEAVRVEASLRLVLGMTSSAIQRGLSPGETLRVFELAGSLPLKGRPLSFRSRRRLALLNLSYPAFYYCKLIVEKCKR